jgi:pyruvate/2-oxoglutarate dehydrogenase complex dihydrolipoamide acyltransferase (E2) component
MHYAAISAEGGTMPAKDESRWTQLDDESWIRTVLVEDDEDDGSVNATAGAITAAEELGVDISTVVGSGKDGKVTKADVEAAAGSDS